jgi:hypothetical protein
MLPVIQVVADSMFNSVRTGRNRRYPDFLSLRQNQCWAAISIVVIVVLASLGFAHLIANGMKNKTSYSGYVMSKNTCASIILLSYIMLLINVCNRYLYIHLSRSPDRFRISHLLSAKLCRFFLPRDVLLRVFPKSESDKKYLQNFDSLNIDAQVWGLPTNTDIPVYIFAKAGSMHRLTKTLHGNKLKFNIIIQNMQT